MNITTLVVPEHANTGRAQFKTELWVRMTWAKPMITQAALSLGYSVISLDVDARVERYGY